MAEAQIGRKSDDEDPGPIKIILGCGLGLLALAGGQVLAFWLWAVLDPFLGAWGFLVWLVAAAVALLAAAVLTGWVIRSFEKVARALKRTTPTVPTGGHAAPGRAMKEYRPASLRDAVESRTFTDLKGLAPIQARSVMADFDVVYLRLAYPTGDSSAHDTADPKHLHDGIKLAKRKSLILGRLAAHELAHGHYAMALQYATHSLIAARSPPSGSGDLVGARNIAHGIMSLVEPAIGARLERLSVGYEESERTARLIREAATQLSESEYRQFVAAAASELSSWLDAGAWDRAPR